MQWSTMNSRGVGRAGGQMVNTLSHAKRKAYSWNGEVAGKGRDH